jgi:hypothetical protein
MVNMLGVAPGDRVFDVVMDIGTQWLDGELEDMGVLDDSVDACLRESMRRWALALAHDCVELCATTTMAEFEYLCHAYWDGYEQARSDYRC